MGLDVASILLFINVFYIHVSYNSILFNLYRSRQSKVCINILEQKSFLQTQHSHRQRSHSEALIVVNNILY